MLEGKLSNADGVARGCGQENGTQAFELVYSHPVSKMAQELLKGDIKADIIQKTGNLKDPAQIQYDQKKAVCSQADQISWLDNSAI